MLVSLCLIPGLAMAQQSASFDVREQVLNSGGAPLNGVSPSSPGYRISMLAIGGSIVGLGSSSASFQMDAGFVSGYPAPGEVSNVRFMDEVTLLWDGEHSATSYNRYQGSVTRPFDPGYGACALPAISTNSLAFPDTPPPGDVLFILLTAENRLSEEGTKGTSSIGMQRVNLAPCQ